MTADLPRCWRIDGLRNLSCCASRRSERDTFRVVVMPAAWLCGAFVLLGTAIHGLSTGSMVSELTGVGLGLLVPPVVLFFYPITRGHFSAAFDEP